MMEFLTTNAIVDNDDRIVLFGFLFEKRSCIGVAVGGYVFGVMSNSKVEIP